jgi:hypothetical protein
MATRKRSSSGSKRPKEKVVYIYELMLRGEDFSSRDRISMDEFFLLAPNPIVFEAEILKLNEADLMAAKQNLNLLFSEAINMLSSEHPKRVQNALVTLITLFHSSFHHNFIQNFPDIEAQMKMLINHCGNFLQSDQPDSPRDLCLKLILILVTGAEVINSNILIEYIMINSLFDSLIRLLSDPILRGEHGHEVVILLTLLVNYRKHEGSNPYIVQLSILADEMALNGYGQVISSSLIDFCRQYTTGDEVTSSWFSSFSNIVGNIFVSDDADKSQQARANNARALLLALYEAVHLNRNFITTLAHTLAESSSPPSPRNTLSE